ncbi:hypothetical protein PR048_013577 [Dryococelus australis]|uniref:Reverse transcriptase domain-containing protein n=1 Tax=Dryococelus australis TaxID=614101 RepID=A0ABQ9HT00_9NEOP|nr:hypothetical protein PR048_013577 [Dryococelus australis]
MLLTNTNYITDMAMRQELGSDHFPITVNLAIPTKKEKFRRTNREKTRKKHTPQSPQTTWKTLTGRTVVNEELDQLITERNRAFKSHQRIRTQESKAALDSLNKKIKEVAENHKHQAWEKLVNDLQHERNGIWKLNHILIGKKTKTCTPVIHGERGIVYIAEEKLEAIAEALVLQFEPNHQLTPTQTIEHMRAIYNKILKTSYFPPRVDAEKNNHLTQTRGKSYFPQNRWPISLLNTMAKVFEKILIKRIQNIVTQKMLLPNKQIGFWQHHSTIHAATRVAKYIITGYNNKKHTAALYIDIEKAYDKVKHTFLIHKLIEAGFPSVYWELIPSYLSNRKFHVTLDGHLSSQKNIETGVPQGLVLSPLLYALYTRDKPKCEVSSFILYAGDPVIYAKDRKVAFARTLLQGHAKKQEEY